MIYSDFIYSVTFISFLSFLFLRFFIMSKCCFDHFFLTQFIFVEDVQMLSLCECCVKQKKFCVVSDKSDKCSKCVHLKKSCSLFFSFLIVNVAQLLKACEKIEKKQIALSNEKQCLFEAFQAAEIKKY